MRLNSPLSKLIIWFYDTLLNYSDCNIPFAVQTDASDKPLGAIIS